MSALEEIQTAVDGLKALRSTSDSGAWTVAGVHPDCSIEGDVNFIAGDLYDYDAALIVTLHRTIDAQLAILGYGLAVHRDKYQNLTPPVEHYALALARAITGTT